MRFKFHASPQTKKRDNSTEPPRLISFLILFQVVRMIELFEIFWMRGVYQIIKIFAGCIGAGKQ